MQDDYLGTAIDFSAPLGEPALLSPDSVQWRVYTNPIALGLGGIAAVLLEFAEPRLRSGVWDHSNYQATTIGSPRRTGLLALPACYVTHNSAQDVTGKTNPNNPTENGQPT